MIFVVPKEAIDGALAADRPTCELCGEPIRAGEKTYQPAGQEPVHFWCKFGDEGT